MYTNKQETKRVEKERGRKRGSEREIKAVCMCVYLCVWVKNKGEIFKKMKEKNWEK